MFHYRKNFKPSIKLGENWNTLLQNAEHTGDTAAKISSESYKSQIYI